MRKLLLASTAAAALTLGFAGTADAVTVTNLADAPAAWAAALAGTANTLNVPGTWSVLPSVRVGNLANVYRSPFDNEDLPGNPDNSAFIGLEYYAVGPGNPNNPAVMTFTSDQTSLTFLWGSVDSYNTLEFYDNNVLIATVLNTDISPAPGNVAGRGAAYVAISGLLFDEIRFNSGLNALEFSNMTTTPVPLPAALPLMLAGLAGIGLVARRRASTSA
jgi:hypothetical protein